MTDQMPEQQSEVEDTPLVLIVDDVSANRATVMATLSSSGYRFLEAADGAEGLALARAHRPDLMLLDVMMPGMDAYEVIRELRRDAEISEMPIVLVTALDDTDALLEGFAAGADDFVNKPYNSIELRARIRGILRLNRFRRLLDERTARREAEEHVIAVEALYKEIIDGANLMIQSFGPDGDIRFVNNSWRRILGYTQEDMDGLCFDAIVHPSSRDHCQEVFQRVMGGEAVLNLEATLVSKDGRQVDVSGAAIPRMKGDLVVATHTLFMDITERNALEANLRQAQKLEQVGRLAAGIAHDFGNVLAVVSMNAALVHRHTTLEGLALTDVSEIQEAVEDGLALVGDLMGLSRQAELHPTRLDMAEMVPKLVELLSRLLPARVRVVQGTIKGSTTIVADAKTIRQMVINLGTNARDAIEKHGEIRISVDDTPPPAESDGASKLDAAVRLSISDTGGGMTPETLLSIFDPFFTTKEEGKGTGLGLATLKGLMEQQRGMVTVESTLGEGTTVHLYFPTAPADTAA